MEQFVARREPKWDSLVSFYNSEIDSRKKWSIIEDNTFVILCTLLTFCRYEKRCP